MHASASPSLSVALRDAAATIPPSVLESLSEIERAGEAAWLVGPALYELLRGRRPLAWEAQTGLHPQAVLERYPHAVVTASRLRCLTIPGPDGPLDVVPRPHPPHLEHDLDKRIFSLFALAYRPATEEWIDPHGGAEHALAGRLATVGPAAPRLRANPLAGLQALRWMATEGLTLDTELEKSLHETAAGLSSCKPFLVREELIRLLGADRPGAALELLRDTGMEALVAPGTRADCAAVLDRLPARRELRLTAWLRETRADSILGRLRFGRDPIVAVLRRLDRHPLDITAVGRRTERVVGRLAREELEDLLALRRAELEVDPSSLDMEAFERLAARLRALHDRKTAPRPELALDGRAIMATLDCEAGPRVGKALRFLGDCVRENPECNRSEELLRRLQQWSREHPA